MSVVTFWNNGKEHTGKSLAIAAMATYMGFEHNNRILVVSTSFNDDTLLNCFFENEETEQKAKKNLGLFGPNTNVAMQNGIEGLDRIVRSNKVTPDIITDYTKVVLKDRLEILPGPTGNREVYDQLKETYLTIIELANQYYDLVIVDLDGRVGPQLKNDIVNKSDLVVATLSQRLKCLNDFNKERQEIPVLNSIKTLILIGRYDKYSKYTSKNITRYLGEKNQVSTLPYCTQFFEAAEEAGVPDMFLRLRKVDKDDRNAFFISEVKRLSDNIQYRLKDLQMR